jgi:hypothetical protein
LKHQPLFRRVEALTREVMPPGYSFAWDPNDVAAAVLSKNGWAVLALTLHIELFTQSHYRESIRENADLSELYRDVFLFHWKEECQHALIDGWSGAGSMPASAPRGAMRPWTSCFSWSRRSTR